MADEVGVPLTTLRQRRYFPLPAWDVRDEILLKAVEQGERAWLKFAAGEQLDGGAALSSIAPHPLIEHYRPRPHIVDDGASPLESSVAESHRDRMFHAISHGGLEAFMECVRSVASSAVGEQCQYRTGPVFTSADTAGVRLVFPRPGTFKTRFGALSAYLQQSRSPAAIRAMVALVAITNCHPFLDGNGRTGRIVWNILMNGSTRRFRYLDLKALGNRPPGNLTLYMRSAELHGDWVGLLSFLTAALGSGTVLGVKTGLEYSEP